jgi:hypothetical protein
VTFALAVTGGAPPYTFTLLSPPSNFTIDATGVIHGTSVAAGLTLLLVQVVDSQGAFTQRSFELMAVDGAQPLAVATLSPIMPGMTGQPLDLALIASGGTPPFTWAVDSGSLPAGVALGTSGHLTGTPTSPGTNTFTVKVTDAASPAGSATAALSLRIDDVTQPLHVTVDASTVKQPHIARVGFNISEGPVYWNDNGYTNEYLNNPSFEPTPAHRQMHFIASGTADTITTAPEGNGFFDDPDGFYTGGRYWILSGAAKGRTGTIKTHERMAIGTTQYQQVLTLNDNDPTLIPKTENDTLLNNDIVMMESLPHSAAIPAGWKLMGTAAGTVATVTDVKHTGTQSVLIHATAKGQLGIMQGVLFNGPQWRRLRADTTYTLSAWVRQTGIPDGKVTVGLNANWSLGNPIVQQAAVIPDDGAFHPITMTVQGQNQNFVVAAIGITDVGQAWVDDVILYESTATTTWASDPPAPTKIATAYDPIPSIAADLSRTQAGSLRFWWHDSHLTIVDALGHPTADAPGPVHSMYSDLNLAETVGAAAWLCAEKEWLPADYVALVEYLASPDTTQGMGKLRADQGHPMPWTDTIPAIYIEYSDESWNWPFFGYPFDLWHPAKYAAFGQERYQAIRDAGLKPDNLFLVLDGQLSDDYWVNNPVEKDAAPAMDALDNAPYLQMPAIPASDAARFDVGMAQQYFGDTEATRGIWAKRNDTTQLYIYESGPQAGGYNADIAHDARKDSMAMVAPYVDLLGQLLASGVPAINQFVYNANPSWMSVTGAGSRLRLPTSYAIELWNGVAGGADELALTTDAPQVTPVVAVAQSGSTPAHNQDLVDVDAVAVHAYRAGGHIGFGLVSRNPQVTYRVQLPRENGASYMVRTLGGANAYEGELAGPGLTANPVDITQVHETVVPTAQMLGPPDDLIVNVPPSGVVTVLYQAPPTVNGGGGTGSAGANGGGTAASRNAAGGCMMGGASGVGGLGLVFGLALLGRAVRRRRGS